MGQMLCKVSWDNVKPEHTFFSGSRSTGKSHLVKVVYFVISKILLYNCKDPKKRRDIITGPTGISAVNIAGTTIHSGCGIKSGTKVYDFNGKCKAALKSSLSVFGGLTVVELLLLPGVREKLNIFTIF